MSSQGGVVGLTPEQVVVGFPVEVYSFGRWYQGVIESATAKRVWVDYTTGSGARRVKAYSRADERIRPVPDISGEQNGAPVRLTGSGQ